MNRRPHPYLTADRTATVLQHDGREQPQLPSKLPKRRKMVVQRRQRVLPSAPGGT